MALGQCLNQPKMRLQVQLGTLLTGSYFFPRLALGADNIIDAAKDATRSIKLRLQLFADVAELQEIPKPKRCADKNHNESDDEYDATNF
jgi:hypothetical protein